MTSLVQFDNSRSLNKNNLILALDLMSSLWLGIPHEIQLWIQQFEQEEVLELLLAIVLEQHPKSYIAAEMSAEIDRQWTIDNIASHLTSVEREQQKRLLSILHFIVPQYGSLQLPIEHSTIQTLLQILTDTNSADRYMAVKLLGRLGTADLFDTFLQYYSDNDQDVYYEIISELIHLDFARALPIIQPLAVSDDEILRWCICYTLTDYPNELAIDLLINRLQHDPDDDVRWTAAFALGLLGNPVAIEPLSNAVKTDKGADYEGRKVSSVAADSIVRIQNTL